MTNRRNITWNGQVTAADYDSEYAHAERLFRNIPDFYGNEYDRVTFDMFEEEVLYVIHVVPRNNEGLYISVLCTKIRYPARSNIEGKTFTSILEMLKDLGSNYVSNETVLQTWDELRDCPWYKNEGVEDFLQRLKQYRGVALRESIRLHGEDSRAALEKQIDTIAVARFYSMSSPFYQYALCNAECTTLKDVSNLVKKYRAYRNQYSLKTDNTRADVAPLASRDSHIMQPYDSREWSPGVTFSHVARVSQEYVDDGRHLFSSRHRQYQQYDILAEEYGSDQEGRPDTGRSCNGILTVAELLGAPNTLDSKALVRVGEAASRP